MSKVKPCLWFDDEIEDAVNFYVALFGDGSSIKHISRYPDGRALTIEFDLRGQNFMALNGRRKAAFNESVSFVVDCKDQAEVDHFWNAMTADGGEESQYAWLKDRYGVSWQIVPRRLVELMSDPDRGRAGRAMQAMMQMRKIVVADLDKAANAA